MMRLVFSCLILLAVTLSVFPVEVIAGPAIGLEGIEQLCGEEKDSEEENTEGEGDGCEELGEFGEAVVEDLRLEVWSKLQDPKHLYLEFWKESAFQDIFIPPPESQS